MDAKARVVSPTFCGRPRTGSRGSQKRLQGARSKLCTTATPTAMSPDAGPGPEMIEFTLLKTTGVLAARLGCLALAGRKSILTPALVGNTSRGVLPHISQDTFRKGIDVAGVYMPLEDFVEKHPQQVPPVLQYDVPAPLRSFTALPPDTLLILGARRNPPIPSPVANSNSEVAMCTSVGYKSISSAFYGQAARRLQPDVVVGLADIPFGQPAVGSKRKDKMSDRTEAWLRDLVAARAALAPGEPRWAIFAPMLPVERDLQAWYLEHLVDDLAAHVAGMAIYDAFLLDDLPDALHHLPRLSFDAPASPHALLRQVALGMDLFTVPFVADATDAGIVLDFTFPAPAKDPAPSARRSLGIDMWHPDHARAVAPLSAGCTCYACTKHHRAYLQHLLAAKEMLGWVLIQLHNHAVLAAFFDGVRASIAAGTFDAYVAAFEAYYESALPEKTGQGPRVRGYQFRSEEHARREKKNPKAYRKLDADQIQALKAAAHNQQPHNKPDLGDVIDNEALLGLMSMDEPSPPH
jgi:queuine tRNA-ribosyltransferase subunit QTRTD1